MVFALLLDVLNTIMRDIITLLSPDSRTAAIGTLACFATLSGFLIVFPLCRQITLLRVLQHVTLLCHFCGDNLDYVFESYADGLPCGDMCTRNVHIATTILLGIASAITYTTNLLPEDTQAMPNFGSRRLRRWIQNWLRSAKEENLKMEHQMSLSIFTILVKIDAYFTMSTGIFASSDSCSRRNVILVWTLFVLFVIVGVRAVILTGANAVYKLPKEKNIKKKWSVITAVILLSITLPLYVLADNRPLDCAWGCDSRADNATATAILRCNTTANTSVRLGLMSVVLLLLVVSLVLSVGCLWFVDGVFEGTFC